MQTKQAALFSSVLSVVQQEELGHRGISFSKQYSRSEMGVLLLKGSEGWAQTSLELVIRDAGNLLFMLNEFFSSISL